MVPIAIFAEKRLEYLMSHSLDTEQEEWLKFVKENNSHLININDTNGWDGKVASEYFIYATPTMFLLDNEKKIIGKPTTFLELKELI